VGGAIYLDVVEPPPPAAVPSERERRAMYHGYRFELECTTRDDAAADAEEGGVVDANVEFISVVATRLGGLKLVIAGEVDAARAEAHAAASGAGSGDGSGAAAAPGANPVEYVEFKATFPRPRTRMRAALRRWWTQSYLLGIPSIVVGYRETADGVLRATETIATADLPRWGDDGRGGARDAWRAGEVVGQLERTLRWIVDALAAQPDGTPCVIRHRPGETVLRLCVADAPSAGGVAMKRALSRTDRPTDAPTSEGAS
jgi:hypothetical protein